jgi:outer membrane protein OmpA-like peptidoglycan-associated protein
VNLSRLRHSFGLLLLFVVVSNFASAQLDSGDYRSPIYIGVFGGYGLVKHDVLLHPDYFIKAPSYSSEKVFTSASGGGIILGGLVEYTLSSNFSVGLRVGYNALGFKPGGDLLNFRYTNSTDLHQGTGIDSVPVTGTVEADVDADLGYINATPHLKITPASLPIYAIGGLTILYPLSATFEFNETVVEPRGALFSRNRPTRKLGSGDIPNAKTALGMTLGIGFDYPLSRKLILFGEAQYLLGMGDIVEQLRAGEKWKVSVLSGIVGIKVGLGGGTPPVVPPPIVVKDTSIPVRDSLFRAAAVTADGFSDTLTITGRRVQGTEVHALLPYIFFPRDSATIPERYVQITKKERSAFSAEKLPRGNTLGVYYNILNIVGQRIREKRKPRNSDGQAGAGKLQIVGCLSNLENGDTALALKRAEAVRDYLRNIWAVPAARMEVSVSAGPGGLPIVPTTSEVDSLEGERENQRVELYYERNSAILEPVELLDSAFLMPAGVIRFFPPQIDTAKVAAWTLDVAVGDVLDKDVKSGFGPPPESIDYPIEVKPGQSMDQPLRVTGSFILRDTTYMEIGRRASEAVVLRQEGDFEEERNTVRGKYLDVFNLLLFHFDSTAVLAFSDEANAIMRDRIAPSSIVRVVGHTDRIGLPPYNRQLSQRRAEVASQALGVPVKEVLGMGEKKLLYDNTFPEGRYYSRTVTVTVETPVEDGDALRRRRATDPNASGGTEGAEE